MFSHASLTRFLIFRKIEVYRRSTYHSYSKNGQESLDYWDQSRNRPRTREKLCQSGSNLNSKLNKLFNPGDVSHFFQRCRSFRNFRRKIPKRNKHVSSTEGQLLFSPQNPSVSRKIITFTCYLNRSLRHVMTRHFDTKTV